jgi:ABC-type sugar transport system ATPase subunit
VAGLHPTDLAFEAGECVALVGPTGSGKSTLLRLIAGLEVPTAGEVWVGGERVDRLPPHRRGVSLLQQRVALYPHLNVAANLSATNTRRAAGFHPLFAKVPEPLLGRYPHQLSGGQRQLVGLAKLVAQNRPVWLLDEPFTGLDFTVREEFRLDLHLLHAQTSATILLVTHDPADALALGRRIGVLGDGRLKQLGTPDSLRRRPGDRFAAVCLAGLSLLDGRVVGDGDSARFTAAEGAVSGPVPRGSPDNLTLGIRPADLLAVPPGTTLTHQLGGIVFRGWPAVSAEPVGSGWLLTLARGTARVRAGWPAGSPPPVGSATDWHLPPDCCHWFRGDTGDRVGD